MTSASTKNAGVRDVRFSPDSDQIADIVALRAAKTAQVASTRCNDLEVSASLPTNGPAARRTNIAAARMKPICWEVKSLVSKNFGQNGEATPNAAYRAA
jgi:hypothetical protein